MTFGCFAGWENFFEKQVVTQAGKHTLIYLASWILIYCRSYTLNYTLQTRCTLIYRLKYGYLDFDLFSCNVIYCFNSSWTLIYNKGVCCKMIYTIAEWGEGDRSKYVIWWTLIYSFCSLSPYHVIINIQSKNAQQRFWSPAWVRLALFEQAGSKPTLWQCHETSMGTERTCEYR